MSLWSCCMVNSFLLWLCGLILIRGKQNMLVCSPILELHSLRSFWLPSLSNWIVNTEDINDLIIPTVTMGRQQEVVVVQLWLWFHRAKLAMQEQNIKTNNCTSSFLKWRTPEICFLTAEWNKISLRFHFDCEAVTHLRQPGALCCPELLGFATFVM